MNACVVFPHQCMSVAMAIRPIRVQYCFDVWFGLSRNWLELAGPRIESLRFKHGLSRGVQLLQPVPYVWGGWGRNGNLTPEIREVSGVKLFLRSFVRFHLGISSLSYPQLWCYAASCHVSCVTIAWHVWRYLEVLLRQVSSGNIVFSEMRRHFVKLTSSHDSSSSSNQTPINPEEYSNVNGAKSISVTVC